MKRIAWIFAALALAIFAVLAIVVVLLPREALKTRIGEQIAAWTGRDVSLRGDPELDFFPEVTVTLKDVQVGGPPAMTDAEIVSMERLTGKIRLLPLVIGRVEIGSYRIVRPLIRLVRDDAGARNWAFESGAAALQLAFAGDVPLGDFVMEDGTLIYQNRRDGVIERVDSLNLNVAWPSVRAPLVIGGSGIWRGEQFSFSATTDAPFEFISGESTALQAGLDSVPLAMVFRGTAADFNTPRMTGDLSLTTPSLRGFAAWLGSPIGPGSTLGPASLSGDASFSEGVLSVEDARLTLDGNDATGAVKVAASRRPDISGTLAFANLDLTPYFSGIVSALPSGAWQDVDIDTDWFQDLTADVRLSAGSVQIGTLRFGETAASASLREARLEIGIAEAAFSGGVLTGDLAISRTPAGSETVEAQLRASGFDLTLAAPALGLPDSLAGNASVAMDFLGHATNVGSLIADMRGTASLDLRNGRIPLFGIGEVAAGAPANAVLASDGSVTSPISDLAARLSFAGGAATLEQAKVVAPDFSVAATGRIGLIDGLLDLDGAIRLSSGAPAIPFSLNGSLSRPVVQTALPTN